MDDVRPKSRGEGSFAPLGSPFVRQGELADIENAIDNEESLAVILRYDPGLGASTILRELSEQAGLLRAVVTIHGTPSLSSVPFGALAPLLQGVQRGDVSNRTNVYRTVLTTIAESGVAAVNRGAEPSILPLVIVDDAHAVDPSTAELLVTLVLSGAVKLVASHLRSRELPAPLPKLWSIGRAETIDLTPLTRDEGHEFIRALLGAPVALATSWYFWSNAGGNPLLLKILVSEALDDGLLNQSRGVWVSRDGHHRVGRSLRSAVQQQIRGLGPTAANALDLVALAEPVSAALVEQISSPAAVVELMSRNLVNVQAHDGDLLRLANPIYGEVIRQMVPQSQRRILHDGMLEYLETEPTNIEALLRRVSWAVDSGVDVPAERLLSAALIACKLSQPTLALELLARLDEGNFGLRARAISARAYYMLGDYQQAGELLDAGFDEANSLAELMFGSLLRATTRMALGMPAERMKEDINSLNAAGERLAAQFPEQAPEIRDQVAQKAKLLELLLLSQTGDYVRMVPLIESTLAENSLLSAPDSRLNHTVALAIDAERLCALGQTTRSQQRSAEAFAIEHAEDHDVFFLPEMIIFRQLATALCASDLPLVAKLLDAFFVEAGPIILTFGGGASVARGMGFIRQGLLEEAVEALLPGIESLRISDPQQLLGYCTSMAAYATAKLGQHQLAETLLRDHAEKPGMFLVTAHERAFIAAAHEYISMDGAGVASLLSLADSARNQQSHLLELNALALAVELGELSVLERLLQVAPKVDGEWAEAILHFGQELRHDLPDGPGAAEPMSSPGSFPRVGEISWFSAPLFDAVPLVPRSLQHAPGLDHTTAAHSPAQLEAKVQLTQREREVAIMAAEGLSDRVIAEKLHLSIRTVEGHLYRCYAKLGIAARVELADIDIL